MAETSLVYDEPQPVCFGSPQLRDGKIRSLTNCGKCAVSGNCVKLKVSDTVLRKHPCFGKRQPFREEMCDWCVLEQRCEAFSKELGLSKVIACSWCGSTRDWRVNLFFKGGRVMKSLRCSCEHEWGEIEFSGGEQEISDYIECSAYSKLKHLNSFYDVGVSDPFQVTKRCAKCHQLLECLGKIKAERGLPQKCIPDVGELDDFQFWR
jgi:hypothetical protein